MTLILVNTFGWLIIQLSIAAIAIRIDSKRLSSSGSLYRVHTSEMNFYKRWLHVRRWKGLLPDGAPWVGGNFPKKSLQGIHPAYLNQLIVETRRGELAHWLMLASFPVFFPWNPPWARIVILFYALVANFPCIIVQRYNRYIAHRLQQRHIGRVH